MSLDPIGSPPPAPLPTNNNDPEPAEEAPESAPSGGDGEPVDTVELSGEQPSESPEDTSEEQPSQPTSESENTSSAAAASDDSAMEAREARRRRAENQRSKTDSAETPSSQPEARPARNRSYYTESGPATKAGGTKTSGFESVFPAHAALEDKPAIVSGFGRAAGGFFGAAEVTPFGAPGATPFGAAGTTPFGAAGTTPFGAAGPIPFGAPGTGVGATDAKPFAPLFSGTPSKSSSTGRSGLELYGQRTNRSEPEGLLPFKFSIKA